MITLSRLTQFVFRAQSSSPFYFCNIIYPWIKVIFRLVVGVPLGNDAASTKRHRGRSCSEFSYRYSFRRNIRTETLSRLSGPGWLPLLAFLIFHLPLNPRVQPTPRLLCLVPMTCSRAPFWMQSPLGNLRLVNLWGFFAKVKIARGRKNMSDYSMIPLRVTSGRDRNTAWLGV